MVKYIEDHVLGAEAFLDRSHRAHGRPAEIEGMKGARLVARTTAVMAHHQAPRGCRVAHLQRLGLGRPGGERGDELASTGCNVVDRPSTAFRALAALL